MKVTKKVENNKDTTACSKWRGLINDNWTQQWQSATDFFNDCVNGIPMMTWNKGCKTSLLFVYKAKKNTPFGRWKTAMSNVFVLDFGDIFSRVVLANTATSDSRCRRRSVIHERVGVLRWHWWWWIQGRIYWCARLALSACSWYINFIIGWICLSNSHN